MLLVRACTIALLAMVSVIGAPSSSARAKGWSGPILVMNPRGDVFRVPARDARPWARAYPDLICEKACASPEAEARVAYEVASAEVDPWLVTTPATFRRRGWTLAYRFYPSTRETKAFLMIPNNTLAGKVLWGSWNTLPPRVEEVILRARSLGSDSSSRLPHTGAPLFALLFIAALALGVGLVVLRPARSLGS